MFCIVNGYQFSIELYMYTTVHSLGLSQTNFLIFFAMQPLPDIEDGFNFALICPFYNDLRSRFLPKYYFKHPSMYKFIELLNSNNRRTLIQLTSN